MEQYSKRLNVFLCHFISFCYFCSMMNDNGNRLPIGTMLQDGKYRIDGYLSSGGFGNTYVAYNSMTGEEVAIKEFFMRSINKHGDNTGVSIKDKSNQELYFRQLKKFQKEAQRLRKLNNPHIVSVYSLFEENGTAYYEMDLIKGESLSDKMERSGSPFSESEVLHVLSQLLDALEAVHSQDLVHLDLKPSNVMVDDQGNVSLIDFGASKHVTPDGRTLSAPSMLVFTPGFAPLEQIDQNIKNFGPWTDFYALGATLYKLLTQESPPSATELLETQSQLTFPANVSSDMQQLILWMMNANRKNRPQDVNDVRTFLVGHFGNQDVPPLPVIDATSAVDDDDVEVVMVNRPVQEPAYGHLQKKQKSNTIIAIVAFVLGLFVVAFVAILLLLLI